MSEPKIPSSGCSSRCRPPPLPPYKDLHTRMKTGFAAPGPAGANHAGRYWLENRSGDSARKGETPRRPVTRPRICELSQNPAESTRRCPRPGPPVAKETSLNLSWPRWPPSRRRRRRRRRRGRAVPPSIGVHAGLVVTRRARRGGARVGRSRSHGRRGALRRLGRPRDESTRHRPVPGQPAATGARGLQRMARGMAAAFAVPQSRQARSSALRARRPPPASVGTGALDTLPAPPPYTLR